MMAEYYIILFIYHTLGGHDDSLRQSDQPCSVPTPRNGPIVYWIVLHGVVFCVSLLMHTIKSMCVLSRDLDFYQL